RRDYVISFHAKLNGTRSGNGSAILGIPLPTSRIFYAVNVYNIITSVVMTSLSPLFSILWSMARARKLSLTSSLMELCLLVVNIYFLPVSFTGAALRGGPESAVGPSERAQQSLVTGGFIS